MAGEHVLTVSFEIAWGDTEKARTDYSQIYKALKEAIKDGLGALDYWEENTSNYVVRTQEDASAFLIRVWNASGMRPTKDRILILDANIKAGAAAGAIHDRTLFSLLPFVTELK